MSRLILFYGSDSHLLDEGIEELIQEILPDTVRAWNLDVIDGTTADLDRMLLSADSLPFAFDRRVTLVRQPAFALYKGRGGSLSDEQKRLLDYLDRADPTNFLIFRVETDAQPGAFLKKLMAKAEVRRLDKLEGEALITWVSERLARDKKALSRDAVALISEEARHRSMAELSAELEKAVLYVGRSPVISREDLLHTLSPSPHQSIFQLLDHVCAGRAEAALASWQELRMMHEEPGSVLYRLTDQLKTILAVQGMQRERRTQKDMANLLGKHPYVIKKSLQQARQLEEIHLAEGLALLLSQTLKSRQSQGISEEALLEETILMLIARLYPKSKK